MQKGNADNIIKSMTREDLETITMLLASKVNNLTEIILSMKRQSFGRKSEKFNPDQLNIFELLGLEDNTVVIVDGDDIPDGAKQAKKKPRKPKGKALSGLPVKEVHYNPDSTVCPICGKEMHEIAPTVINELVYIPAKIYIKKSIFHNFACFNQHKDCDESNNDHLKIYHSSQPVPVTLFEKSAASPAFVAHTAYDLLKKCVPLYRQEKAYKDMGYNISRTLLSNWLWRSMNEYLRFIVDKMRHDFLRLSFIHLDETELNVLEEVKRGTRNSDSYVWIGMSGEIEDKQMAIYSYGPGRSINELKKMLIIDGEHFSGTAVTDGYTVYDNYTDFSGHAGCWAHARRYIEDAMKIQTNIYKEFHNKSTSDDRRHEILKDNPAFGHQLCLLQMIGKVFGYERKLKGKNAGTDEILKVREELELPILKEIHAKILEIQEKFLPSGKFSAAMNYIVKQWKKLLYYISHPEVPISNNLIEREGVKPFVMTRKNVLFANSVEGAETMMNWFTLFTSAKMNNLDFEKYITYALSELSIHKMTQETIERLLPYSKSLPDDIKISNNSQE